MSFYSNNPRGFSDQQQYSQKYGTSNFNTAFSHPSTLIEKTDYTNKGHVVHNNLGQNLLAEHVFEYKIKLNSNDTNSTYSPSIFKQRIDFDSNIGSLRKFKNVKYISIDSIMLPKSLAIDISKIVIPSNAYDVNNKLVNTDILVTDIYPADSQYNQNTNISGVLSGNLSWDSSIIPSTGYFSGTLTSSITNLTDTFHGSMTITSFNSSSSTYSGTFTGTSSTRPEKVNVSFSDVNISSGVVSGGSYSGTLVYIANSLSSSNLMSTIWNHPHLILEIEELNSDLNMGSSSLLSNKTFLFKYDQMLGNDMTLWKPVHGNIVVYKNSLLSNLSKLNLRLLDENGTELALTDLNGNKIVGNPLNLLNSNISSKYTGDYNEFVKNFLGTSSVKYTTNVTQILYNLTVGVIENELNTQTGYY